MPSTPAELYALAPTDRQPPDGLVVIGGMACPLCSASMRNNDYPTATQDGTPITWLNTDEGTPGHRVFFEIPGIEYRADSDAVLIGGKPMGGVPAVLRLRDGRVAMPVVKYGEIARGEFEHILNQIRLHESL